VATLEVLERFLELDGQRLQIVRAFGALGRQALRVRRELFLRRLLELSDLPTELVRIVVCSSAMRSSRLRRRASTMRICPPNRMSRT